MFWEDRILDPDGDLFLILTYQAERTESDNSKDDENDTSQKQIRVRCSSKHLTLASAVFKAMLSERFQEGAILRATGALTLALPDDDAAALLILLSIMHAQTEETPLEIDLCMLTRIAILVDKYRLHTTVKMCTRIWTKEATRIWNKEAKIKDFQNKDIRRWIFIAWVFHWSGLFKVATRMAERATTSRIDDSGCIDLPIPLSVADFVDQHRQKALADIINEFHSILEQYQGPNMTCTMKCDAIVLGSLTKAMKSMQILIPPEPPYSNLSFDRLADDIRKMDILTTCEEAGRGTSCTNGIKKDMVELVKGVATRLCGLDLDIMGGEIFG